MSATWRATEYGYAANGRSLGGVHAAQRRAADRVEAAGLCGNSPSVPLGLSAWALRMYTQKGGSKAP